MVKVGKSRAVCPSSVETVLFKLGFIPKEIRNDWIFFFYNLLSNFSNSCALPLAYPCLPRTCVQKCDMWAPEVWLLIQTRVCCWMVVAHILFIASKCNEFVTSIHLHCKPVSEHVHLSGLLLVFPEPLQSTIMFSWMFLNIFFLLWKKLSCITGW